MARGKNTDMEEFSDDTQPVRGLDSTYIPESFEAAMADLQAADMEIEEVVSPWTLIEDKTVLVGQPFLIVDFSFNSGDYGPDGFVSVRAITPDDNRIVFNDGSSGILQTLREMQRRYNRSGGFLVKNGLRKSDYWYDETEGRSITSASEASTAREAGHTVIPAATFYLV